MDDDPSRLSCAGTRSYALPANPDSQPLISRSRPTRRGGKRSSVVDVMTLPPCAVRRLEHA